MKAEELMAMVVKDLKEHEWNFTTKKFKGLFVHKCGSRVAA